MNAVLDAPSHRPISELPPVLTPAEKARMNGHAVPQPEEEHPATAIVEVPEGGTVDPGPTH